MRSGLMRVERRLLLWREEVMIDESMRLQRLGTGLDMGIGWELDI